MFLPSASARPGIVHVNPYETISPELERMAVEEKFDIYVQGDSPEVLSDASLRELLGQYNVESLSNTAAVTPEWVVKYTVFSKTRGVLLNKGYFVMTALE
ncbi:hypothetical protein HDU67_004985 [Dinochytrium kinnereticum]|nr:hypothetical protein HDU67_004985 [Dinochytrium kinnereticum]